MEFTVLPAMGKVFGSLYQLPRGILTAVIITFRKLMFFCFMATVRELLIAPHTNI